MTPKQQWLKDNLRDGEEYAGIILGKRDYHLFLLPGAATGVNGNEHPTVQGQ